MSETAHRLVRRAGITLTATLLGLGALVVDPLLTLTNSPSSWRKR